MAHRGMASLKSSCTGQSSSADAYECKSPMVPVPPALTPAQEAPVLMS